MILSWRRRLSMRLEGLTSWEDVRRNSSRCRVSLGVVRGDAVVAGVAGETVEDSREDVLSART